MAVSYTYALCPFDWIPPSGNQPGYHAPPGGSKCVLDLRSNTQAGTRGPSAGHGFFAFTGSVPGSAVPLAIGDCRETVADAAMRNAIKTTLSLSATPAGATLIDCIADAMNSLGDPTGVNGVKPIMPGADGRLELHLGGHRPVWSRQLDVAELLSANPKGHANRIRDVIRADLDIAEAIGGAPLLQKALGAVLLKCGVSREELKAGASGRKSQYDRLMSAAVKAKHGPNAKPAKPETQAVETWPTNGSIDTQDNTWSRRTVAVWGASSYLVGQSGTMRVSHGNAFYAFGRCETAMSSADHWAQADLTCSNVYGAAVASRVHATDETAYFGEWGWQGRTLKKYVAGALTALATVAVGGGCSGQFAKMRSDGSTQTLAMTGFADQVTTDTSITGSLKGGAAVIVGAGQESLVYVGPVTIDDGLGGGGGSSRNPSSLGMLGVG